MDLLTRGVSEEDLLDAFAGLENVFFSQFLHRVLTPTTPLEPSSVTLYLDGCPQGSLPCTEARAAAGVCIPGEGLNIYTPQGEECFSRQSITKASVEQLRKDAEKKEKKLAKKS